MVIGCAGNALSCADAGAETTAMAAAKALATIIARFFPSADLLISLSFSIVRIGDPGGVTLRFCSLRKAYGSQNLPWRGAERRSRTKLNA
jgi:hypothetical protein